MSENILWLDPFNVYINKCIFSWGGGYLPSIFDTPENFYFINTFIED